MPSTIQGLSAPKAVLLSASLAASADIPRIRCLISKHPTAFSQETLLRVLLFLPETTPPQTYIPLLNAILRGEQLGIENENLKFDLSPVEDISDNTAQQKLSRLLPVLTSTDSTESLVTSYLIARADHIDTETGALSIAAELLQQFRRLPAIDQLFTGTVKVLYKLVYAFEREPTPELAIFRQLQVEDALEVLIADPDTITSDLAELVEPYLAVKAKKEWRHVWARLGALPLTQTVAIINEWDPPDDEEIREEWARWAIQLCYLCKETDPEARDTWEGMHSVHRRVGELMKLPEGEMPEKVGDLKDRQNSLFAATKQNLALLDTVISSSALLERSLAETVRIRLESSSDVQKAVMRQYVRSGANWDTRDDAVWTRVRDGARWLRQHGVLPKLTPEDVEQSILAGMLSGARFGLAKNIYVTNNRTSDLSLEEVEKVVLTVFNDYIDNATNGNKTRGKMKHAHQTLQILGPTPSPAITRAHALLNAIHALSSYSLTTRNGAPLLPVQIRITHHPLSLIPPLLNTNPCTFLKPDHLISIAQDLVLGTGGDPIDVPEKVLGMCTEAALQEQDFDTAYSFCTSRLLPLAKHSQEAASTLWRAALLAGKFGAAYEAMTGISPMGPTGLKLLEQKRELLAYALDYCPPEASMEVLAQWRRNEEEMEVLLELEKEAEAEHVRLGSGPVQQQQQERRASISREGEAPQSLFEVARGAARVFTAGRGMDMGAVGAMGSTLGGLAGGLQGGLQAMGQAQTADGERTRKRDIVGGMVTRGLAGGLGWVLGAQPNMEQQRR